MFDFGKGNSKFENGIAELFGNHQLPPRPNMMFDIISARNVVMPNMCSREEKEECYDCHCVVKIGSKTIHRTEVDTKSRNGTDLVIWTLQSGSLGLFYVPEEEEQQQQRPDVDNKNDSDDEHNNNNSITIEVKQGTILLGIVTIPFREILAKKGKRDEYPIIQQLQQWHTNDNDAIISEESKNEEVIRKNLGILALRFRRATKEDIAFFQQKKIIEEKRLKEMNYIRRSTIA